MKINKKILQKIIKETIDSQINLQEIKKIPEYKTILKFFDDKTSTSLLKNGSFTFQCKDRPNLVYSITNSGYLRRDGPIFKFKGSSLKNNDYKIMFSKILEDYKKILHIERKSHSVRHLGKDYGMKYEKYFVSDEKFRKDNLMWAVEDF